MLKDYYELAKPGIVYGNVITTVGGFVLAARGNVQLSVLAAAIVGLSLVVGSGSTFNNYLDRDIDARMERTKNRALVAGRISGRAALVYATVLGVAGFATLALFANWIATAVAGIGFFFYVFAYTLWSKRRAPFGTVVGSISGAVPPVIGYCAASGRLDGGALILFAILVLWQMPHFFAIGIYRREEYAAAGIPILPVAYGVRAAKWASVWYILAFASAAFALGGFGYFGDGAPRIIYLAIAALLCVIWLAAAAYGFRARNDSRWARGMFFVSLAVLVFLFISIIGVALSLSSAA